MATNGMQFGQPSTRQTTATRQVAPGQQLSGPTISDVNSPIGRNLGLVGTMLGLGTRTTGLGVIGDALQTGMEAQAYNNLHSGFRPNVFSGFINNVTPFGLFGTPISQQARSYAQEQTGLSPEQYKRAADWATLDISARPDIFGGGGNQNESDRYSGWGGGAGDIDSRGQGWA